MLNDGELFPVLQCISPPADHVLPPTVAPLRLHAFLSRMEGILSGVISITMGRFDICAAVFATR
jgi:hypothetical protein